MPMLTACIVIAPSLLLVSSGVLCGVDAATSKASISSHARSVVLHAEARKTIKCVLKEVKLPSDADAAHPKPQHKDEETKHKDKKMKLNNNK
jgi:hypothetical protein